jgi:hypothetical protein
VLPFISRAQVVDIRPDSMVVRTDAIAYPVVPLAQVRWFAVRRGLRGHTLRGASIGAAIGVIVGASFPARGVDAGSSIVRGGVQGDWRASSPARSQVRWSGRIDGCPCRSLGVRLPRWVSMDVEVRAL